MTVAPAEQRYDAVARAVHWLSLFAIAIAFMIALTMEGMPRGPGKTQIVDLHASFGALLLALTVGRLAWRAVTPVPDPLPGTPLMQSAMKAMDAALYLLLLAIPITGILMMGAKDRAFDVFGLFTVSPLIAPDKAFAKSLEETHELLAYVMLGLVCLHVAAAFFHHVVLKDVTLERMLPLGWLGRTAPVDVPPTTVRDDRSDPQVVRLVPAPAAVHAGPRNDRPHARIARENDRGGRE